ncbi:co-chaperone GroES [Rhodococcus sp. IEGM 1351]|uniref:GroES family chaperonin n=1 Tax=Rhodococcus sp. IEGM 1351 TaxID=3047089 RepID=UPI0024B78E5E|nr:co-chaperone GroES [Rhodococcus sp. IEGM 1351]MDI9934698.1 co-chaperone GroES [Rhodococcus sp. IEGM 1351]
MKDNTTIPTPLANRVLAVRREAAQTTASGIYLPDSHKEKPSMADVKAVGPDVKDIAVGDTIVFKEYALTELNVGGTNYIVLKSDEVLATI